MHGKDSLIHSKHRENDRTCSSHADFFSQTQDILRASGLAQIKMKLNQTPGIAPSLIRKTYKTQQKKKKNWNRVNGKRSHLLLSPLSRPSSWEEMDSCLRVEVHWNVALRIWSLFTGKPLNIEKFTGYPPGNDHISHLGKSKIIIFKSALVGDMIVPRKEFLNTIVFGIISLNWFIFSTIDTHRFCSVYIYSYTYPYP